MSEWCVEHEMHNGGKTKLRVDCPYCEIERLKAEIAHKDMCFGELNKSVAACIDGMKSELSRYKQGVEYTAGRYDYVDIEDIVRDMEGDRFRVLVMKEGGDE